MGDEEGSGDPSPAANSREGATPHRREYTPHRRSESRIHPVRARTNERHTMHYYGHPWETTQEQRQATPIYLADRVVYLRFGIQVSSQERGAHCKEGACALSISCSWLLMGWVVWLAPRARKASLQLWANIEPSLLLKIMRGFSFTLRVCFVSWRRPPKEGGRERTKRKQCRRGRTTCIRVKLRYVVLH